MNSPRKRKHLVCHTWTVVVNVVGEALHFVNSSSCPQTFVSQYWLDQIRYESSVVTLLNFGLCLAKDRSGNENGDKYGEGSASYIHLGYDSGDQGFWL